MSSPFGIASTSRVGILHLPAADDDVSEEVMDHLLEMDAPSRGEAVCLILLLLETCLDDERDDPSPLRIAQLAFMAGLPAMTETIALQIAFGRGAVPRTALGRLFHGETLVPDAERMAHGIALLRTAASLAPPPLRPPLLCALAWLQWARGKRAIAQAYLTEASRIEPEYVLASGLTWLIGTGRPAWVEQP